MAQQTQAKKVHGARVSVQRATLVAHDEDRLARVLLAKGDARIAVCLPTDQDAATVGVIVEAITTSLVRGCRLVDEILVVDNSSTDGTADLAAAAGARVMDAASSHHELGEAMGRGDLLWRGVGELDADLIVWLDADVTNFRVDSVVRLIEPLLMDEQVSLVRGRPSRESRAVGEGGHVTEVVARPVLALLDEQFSTLREPFCGDYAARSTMLRSMSFEPDYGVEIGLLADVAREYGIEAIREVDLEMREHQQRSLALRARHTRQLMRAALEHAGRATVRGALPLRPAHDELAIATMGGTR